MDELRPLQTAPIRTGLASASRDFVVLPTGGGKSLCYQAPALLSDQPTVVVSPLIALMKDQVDALTESGVAAACIHSGLNELERRRTWEAMQAGTLKLLYCTPERLVQERFGAALRRLDISFIAIDEAHCISHWGHDFRPEYRPLSRLQDTFPTRAVHAFTATATRRCATTSSLSSICAIRTCSSATSIAPNLTYRVAPAAIVAQSRPDAERHPEASGHRLLHQPRGHRSDGSLADAKGIAARPYHAGLSPEQRRKTQEAFSKEKLDVVVATVAFGMGIDRSNVRAVIHATMPKSVEHYQQETGRAGRDGLEAECVLLYSGGDAGRWRSLIERNADENDDSEEAEAAQFDLLEEMAALLRRAQMPTPRGCANTSDKPATATRLRTRATAASTSGRSWTTPPIIAQKILACVARVCKERAATRRCATSPTSSSPTPKRYANAATPSSAPMDFSKEPTRKRSRTGFTSSSIRDCSAARPASSPPSK